MIIKIDTEFLEFDGNIIIEKQAFNFGTLKTAGSFSYSFQVPNTAHNKKILGIPDDSNNDVVSLVSNVELLSNSGIQLYLGYITIDNADGIECSFFSGNNNFFSLIAGDVVDVDLTKYDVLLTESNITSSWTASDGIVFPLTDRGALSTRRNAFMKMRVFNGRLDQNDWQPFIYVKNVVTGILDKAGLKLAGDLVNDSTYASLITTNNSAALKNIILDKMNIYVGTKIVQSIPNGVGSAVKISFELVNDLPFFNSTFTSFDVTLNRWTIKYDCTIRINLTAIISDGTKHVHWQVRRNGIDAGQIFTKSTSVNWQYAKDTQSIFEAHASAGDYYEIWAYIDASTAGTANLISASIKTEIPTSNMCFGQSLVPKITSTDFIADIFKMFNVIAIFDEFTKTINTVLYKNTLTRPEQDLSEYVSSIQSLRNFELISNYSRQNILKYSALDSEDIITYNKHNKIPFGAGEIDVNNVILQKTNDLITLNFKAPFCYKNDVFGLYLIKMNYVEYKVTIDDLNPAVPVTTVTNAAPLAQFNPSVFTFYGNNFIQTSTGNMHAAIGNEIDSDAQIIAMYVPNVTVPIQFRFTASGDNGGNANPDWGIENLYDMTEPMYNGDWEFSGYPSVYRSSCGIAVFAKAQDQTGLDTIRQGVSFGDIKGMNSLTIKETYYGGYEDMLNNPIKPLINFLLPEKIFINLDLLSPVRIRTENLNGLFMINKITGYVDSITPCQIELVKLA